MLKIYRMIIKFQAQMSKGILVIRIYIYIFFNVGEN